MAFPDADRMMAAITQGLVKLARYSRFDTWQPGEKLRILLIGYNGKRNAGADLRVVAMVDQFYRILGQGNIEVGVLTLDVDSIKGYFAPTVRLERFDPMRFWPVAKACCSYHMGVLSEGSCLKSTFANSLTLLCRLRGGNETAGKALHRLWFRGWRDGSLYPAGCPASL
jgi:hypothetical protein